jgi:hypothetical protein
MLAVMAADIALTLVGQPSHYWNQPSAAQEFNRLLAWGMRMGPTMAIAGYVCYLAGAFALATYLPGRLASIVALTFVLAHFAAGSGWVVYRFHLGLSGLYVYAFAVSAALVALATESREPSKTHASGPDGP